MSSAKRVLVFIMYATPLAFGLSLLVVGAARWGFPAAFDYDRAPAGVFVLGGALAALGLLIRALAGRNA